ncbi:hypothetical protein TNCV_946191 [Trichonephila clavipes]|nr:hypothetical protein TNCV_946191 [Trichonephila clavipes]
MGTPTAKNVAPAGSEYAETVRSNHCMNDDNECAVPIMADRDSLEFVQISKIIIDEDSNEENEMNNVARVPKSSEMRNFRKSMHRVI